MLVGHVWIAVLALEDFNDVVNHDEETYYERLTNFKAINSCINVDSIGAENSNIAHVKVVKWAQVDEIAKNWSKHLWNYNRCESVVRDEQWERCHGWNDDFVSPFEVDNVVNEAEEHDHADCEDRCVVLNQLVFREAESYLLLDCNHQKYDRNYDSESFGHWFFILLNTWFVKISSEKSFISELILEGHYEFVGNPEGEYALGEGEHDGLQVGLETLVGLHVGE